MYDMAGFLSKIKQYEKTMFMNRLFLLLITLVSINAIGQVDRVEPPHWWKGFKNPHLQLMIYGKDVGQAVPEIEYQGVNLTSFHRAESENYLFLDIMIGEAATAGDFEIILDYPDGSSEAVTYELKERTRPVSDFNGFDSSDAIYLITPDRFANGDPENDVTEGLHEQRIDRTDDYARHGGDIQGIIKHLDYIEEMGFTAIWSSPLLINDMHSGSYHGYAMTDFYRVDPRFGTLEDYKDLSHKARQKGVKIIMDQVANHVGVEHWWMKDLPFNDWVNFQEKFEEENVVIYSNHRRTTNQDPYASESDKKVMTDGWFVDTMPDLNQENPHMAKYLIQNSIWWIETLGLGGIRQDTYPYPDKDFMSRWAGSIMTEYPNFTIVGEEWSYNPLLIGYWQDGNNNKDGYISNLPSTMDFAMQSKIVQALNEEEGWDTGLIKMYEGLANDFHYASPEDIMIFPDNHDMSRIFTQLKEDPVHTKMALGYLLMMPRIPQIYYGTEILMDDSANPGDHGLIRTDFPGGWSGDTQNAFTGEGLSDSQKEMQSFLKKLLNFRKNSTAVHSGETLHFVPQDGVYVLARLTQDETVVLILNKNDQAVALDLERYQEIGLEGKQLANVLTGSAVYWEDSIELPGKGVYVFTTNN